tara:strand:- start:9467 stop:10876 length:1410 start_codon:yes stop_codon:yes gene_type:complete
MNYLVIDQGTSSTKAFLFNARGQILHQNRIKCSVEKPKPFHVEIDPLIILEDIKELFIEMVDVSGESTITCAGLAIQRSTFLFWEKETCKPVTPAISWQDCRASNISNSIKSYRKKLWTITGTPLSAHFGGPKFLYMTQNNKKLASKIEQGELYFGSLSAFLTHAITGTVAIDHSIACRTMLYNIHKGYWSKYALDLFQVPINCLPPLTPTQHNYGNMFSSNILLSLVIGDQQAALIGQGGLQNKSVAANFGTSASVQYNIGEKPKNIEGLISSVLFSKKSTKTFMVEGTIYGCNSLFYYLENILGITHKKMQWNQRIKLEETNGIFIPGFNGLAAPYWKNGFEDIRVDLSERPNEIIRAAMESIGFLVNDILNCIKTAGLDLPATLTASGGGARSSLLQFIATITGKTISHSMTKDKTAFGIYKILDGNNLDEISEEVTGKIFYPEKIPTLKDKIDKWEQNIKVLEEL